jgi:succinoglycan biosynthesis protein ExoM
MTNTLPHVCICICTHKRAAMLRRLLDGIVGQATDGLFTYSVVVADNDQRESGRAVVDAFAATSGIAVTYCVEPQQNIARTRNKAVQAAHGDYVVFIDDDEFPTEKWLLTLFTTCRDFNVDGVLGPVKPHFDETPPGWVVDGKFYDRPSYPTGTVIDWRKGRTGNTFLKRHVFDGEETPFRPEFLTGEDQDFFRRMIGKGFVFVWCHEALAYEVVPPIRWQRSFMLKRALLRGSISLVHPTVGLAAVAKSAVAAPLYTLALPFAAVLGQGRFMTCLVRLCDHLGRLLAAVGIDPIGKPYVTE